jgi:hypothetical protein
MRSSAAVKAIYPPEHTPGHLPQSATITIHDGKPYPHTKVEVTPKGGRIHFENHDNVEYRLRLFKPKTKALKGIDILLPAKGTVTVVIKKLDIFMYAVVDLIDELASGRGGGPIQN